MGYTTSFQGKFEISPPLSDEQQNSLINFAEERHGGNIKEFDGFPGMYCQWIPTTVSTLAWDEGEKFYNYIEWLQHLVKNFFKPWGKSLNGIVTWGGEDGFDVGRIEIVNNLITIKKLNYKTFEIETKVLEEA